METSDEERKSNPSVLYKGYCIDLLNEIKKNLNFRVNLHLSYDGFYGAKDPQTNQWNGMVGELITGVSRICVSVFCSL